MVSGVKNYPHFNSFYIANDKKKLADNGKQNGNHNEGVESSPPSPRADTVFAERWERICRDPESTIYKLLAHSDYDRKIIYEGKKVYDYFFNVRFLEHHETITWGKIYTSIYHKEKEPIFIQTMQDFFVKYYQDYIKFNNHPWVDKTAERDFFVFESYWIDALKTYANETTQSVAPSYFDTRKVYQFIHQNKEIYDLFYTQPNKRQYIVSVRPEAKHKNLKNKGMTDFLKIFVTKYNDAFVSFFNSASGGTSVRKKSSVWNASIEFFLKKNSMLQDKEKIHDKDKPLLFDKKMISRFMQVEPKIHALYKDIFSKKNKHQRNIADNIAFFLQGNAQKYIHWAKTYQNSRPLLQDVKRETTAEDKWQQCVVRYYPDHRDMRTEKTEEIKQQHMMRFSNVSDFLKTHNPELLKRINQSIASCDSGYLSELIGYFEKTYSKRFIHIQLREIQYLSVEESWRIIANDIIPYSRNNSDSSRIANLLCDGERISRFLHCHSQLKHFRGDLLLAKARGLKAFEDKIRYFLDKHQACYLHWADTFDTEMLNISKSQQIESPAARVWESMLKVYLSDMPHNEEGSQTTNTFNNTSGLTLRNIEEYLSLENKNSTFLNLIKKSIASNDIDYLKTLIDYFMRYHYAGFTAWKTA